MMRPAMAKGLTLADLRSRLSGLLRSAWHREPPPSADAWNAQYAAGKWGYLGQLPELARYSVLVGYLRHFAPGGAVLDVGCGEGVLLQRLRPDDYSRYVGVDFSRASIERAQASASPRATFLVADADRFEPAESFDAVVFNEVLGYLRDPPAAVERCARTLREGGVMLVSMCTAFRGGEAIVAELKRRHRTLDETRVTHGTNPWSWICTALAR
jgi:SAM-dependent methyltransferase